MGRVQDKSIIVTGAASGLGAADARRLAAEGARLVLTDIDAEGLEAIASETGAACMLQDVSDESTWPTVIHKAVDANGRLDVLVNNAGNAIIGTIETTTTEMWRKTMAVHLDGTFFGCHYAIQAMKETGGGSIINMSSVAALQGIPPYLAYSAAKGGIRSMTKSIAAHCRGEKLGIRCNSIHPGSISTPMVHRSLEALSGIKLMESDDPEAMRQAMGIGEPDDVANIVLFLASDESKHVNGAELVVDNADTVAFRQG